MGVDELAGAVINILDVPLELRRLDAPLTATADLDGRQFAGTDERIRLRRRDVQHLSDVAQQEESFFHRTLLKPLVTQRSRPVTISDHPCGACARVASLPPFASAGFGYPQFTFDNVRTPPQNQQDSDRRLPTDGVNAACPTCLRRLPTGSSRRRGSMADWSSGSCWSWRRSSSGQRSSRRQGISTRSGPRRTTSRQAPR